MIVDTSAILAILRAEPEAAAAAEAMRDASVRRISAANWLESAIAIDASGDPIASRKFDELVRSAGLLIEPVTPEQARVGRETYRDFGRGSGHPARLSFGDCFSYALAKTTEEPLLFKGDDFARTDIAGVRLDSQDRPV
ncbi:MAG: type II toxin-antitoxin system VapC family toxin [Chloroflexi bacterium]|nr:type II toxin-antitoxin system VapC family toxin [Chloroflexota bacterium]